MGDNQTPYLHLNLGSNAEVNQNWVKLDARVLQVARGIFADVPAGGDLTGFYPDPQIAPGVVGTAELDPTVLARLPPLPNMPADSGKVLTVAPDGSFIWQSPSSAGANPIGPASGDLTGTYPGPFLKTLVSIASFGLAGRGAIYSGPGGFSAGVNVSNHDATFTASAASWAMDMLNGTIGPPTQIQFGYRAPNAGTNVYTNLLAIRADGTIGITRDGIATTDLVTKGYVDQRAVPAGGVTGNVLAKNSNTAWDTVWLNVIGVPAGGTANQVLSKNSSSDYDISWKAVAAPAQLWSVDSASQLLTPTDFASYSGIWFPGPVSTFNMTPSTYFNSTAGVNDPNADLQITSLGTIELYSKWWTQIALQASKSGSIVLPVPAVVTGWAADHERLDVGGGVKVGTALLAQDGTIQYSGGHFMGRVAGVWTQLDNAAGGSSPWVEDANAIYPVNQTKPVGMGTPTMTTTGVRLDVATAQQITNGESTILIENTAALGTNQKVGYRMKHPGLDCYAVVGNISNVGGTTDYGIIPGSPIGNTNFCLQELASTGMTKIFCQVKETQVTGIDGSVITWMPFCKGYYGPYSGGASTVGPADVRSLSWNWPPYRPGGERRHYRVSFNGSIARAAGQAGVRVQFGLSTGPTTIFDWVSGAVTWATAQWWIEVHVHAGLNAQTYNVQMMMVTDPASQSAAAVAIIYVSKGSLTASMNTSTPNLKLQANFDTSNAGNNVTIADWLFELLPMAP